MSDNVTFGSKDDSDMTDVTGGKTITDFTQIASCAVGERGFETARISLRDKLEREKKECQKSIERTFFQSFRNLLKGF